MNKFFLLTLAASLPLLSLLSSCKRAEKPEAVEDPMAWVNDLTPEEQDIYYGRNQAPEPVEELRWNPEDLLTEKFWSQAQAKDIHQLAKAGADMNAQDENGWTPMMIAAKYGTDPQLLMVLIEHDADFTHTTEDGLSVLTVIENSMYMKNSEVHRNLVTWDLNNKHIEIVAAQQDAESTGPQALPAE